MYRTRKSRWCCFFCRQVASRVVDKPKPPPIDYNDAFAWLEDSIRRCRDPEAVQPWILCAEDINTPFPNTVLHLMRRSTFLRCLCRK